MSNPDAASRFDEIYDSTNKAVLALITAKCANADDVGDIFQDTYMELYRTLLRRGVDYVTNDRGLVLRIAKRKIARYYTLRERFRIFVSMSAWSDDGEEVDLSDAEPDAFCTEDFAVNKVLLESVRQHMERKPDIVHRVFYLYYDVGLTTSEIAKLLGIGESNVKQKLHRTIKELRELLK